MHLPVDTYSRYNRKQGNEVDEVEEYDEIAVEEEEGSCGRELASPYELYLAREGQEVELYAPLR